MKIATWNVNSLKVRLQHLLAWLEANPVDILCVQETKLTDDRFPTAELEAIGYEAVFSGQKTYNGVAILSRHPIASVQKNNPLFADEQQRILAATIGGMRIVCAYMPNGQEIGSDKFAYKMAWLDALRAWIADEMRAHPRLALLGDYNIAPEARDVHDPAEWEHRIHFTAPERAQMAALMELGLLDAFRLFAQPEKQYSWWDYRQMAFRRNRGLRIDHILLSRELAARCTACHIDRETRKWEQPSDHAPVVATLDSGNLLQG
ncbi:exodeoxyribonuclease III [Massilia sp. MS-15]|uniref:exodeoxyribonuclease III n=1 Tax=Massilia sp. MS-15 TaxID=2878200 RepID=UPI001CD792FC|nr:exodeoxyribonuclease III [Massilia sp. MS-15]MCA1247089.1 exodeoxyribonuclease III [Massilia sp. MS-15]